jgi:hypothetical protein
MSAINQVDVSDPKEVQSYVINNGKGIVDLIKKWRTYRQNNHLSDGLKDFFAVNGICRNCNGKKQIQNRCEMVDCPICLGTGRALLPDECVSPEQQLSGQMLRIQNLVKEIGAPTTLADEVAKLIIMWESYQQGELPTILAEGVD